MKITLSQEEIIGGLKRKLLTTCNNLIKAGENYQLIEALRSQQLSSALNELNSWLRLS
tara:strand:+ start:340 stop:513 length:174 start_codon:yes stop_codon:yes gene_type:complete